ncbi:MAG: PhzF family phenazine biosynthesis protein [Paracoccaceae bacterium]
MRRYAVDWVDAFADRPFGGNPCAVVHGADDIPLAERLALVRETRLSECAYVVASERADFGARYYLAEREIPLAGHPTVATLTSLLHRGLVGPGRFTLEVGAGVLPIEVKARDSGHLVTMTQPAPEFGAMHAPAEVAEMYGLAPADVIAPPQTVSTGTPFCIALLRDRDALDRARLDPDLLGAFRRRDGHPDAGLMEPFLVTLGGASAAGDTYARLLLAPPNPPEDSFTGSATGCMAAYLWHHGLIDRPHLVAEQGHGMGRPGRAEVEVLGPRDAPEGVRVGGQGVVLMEGTLRL